MPDKAATISEHKQHETDTGSPEVQIALLTERIKLQYRAEFFNIFNHLQWFGINTGISATNPGTAVTAATRGTSGQLTSTRDPRNIQMALKLFF